MRKITPMVFVVAMSMITSLCYSQTYSTVASDSVKATSGKITTELNVNLFQGNLSFNNALQQIKVRYFLKDHLALRLGLNFNKSKNNSDVSNVYGNSPYTSHSDRKTSTFSLNTGIEKHFRGTKRLSPYVGAEFSLVSKSSQQKTGDATTTTTVKGAWLNYSAQSSSYSERGYFKFGMNMICGFDYYFAKNFFVGYEFLYQFSKTNYKDIDITYSSKSGPVTQPTTPNYDDSESFTGPSVINGVRLGFTF